MTEEVYMRKVRSFILRTGRLTSGQEKALNEQWPLFGLEEGVEALNFPSIFGREAPVTLEIGFGNGSSLAEMAKASPERDFIGIEVHTPGVGHLLHLIGEYQLSNVRVMNTDAVEIIKTRIPAHSLDRVQLFFPDPWHKKRHNKRRIVQPEFVSLLASRMQQGGVFHMATDWKDYARHMASVMEAHTDFESCYDQPYAPRPDFRPLTKFEKRGLDRGHGVWDLLYQRKPL
jgi:tRNA (guanine-N7-)-methyltransferase